MSRGRGCWVLNLPSEVRAAVRASYRWFKRAKKVCGQGETYPHPRECFENGYLVGWRASRDKLGCPQFPNFKKLKKFKFKERARDISRVRDYE